MFSVLITASISSFKLRTLEFPVVASSLPHLLLPITNEFLSLFSSHFCSHCPSVGGSNCLRVLVDWLTASRLSSLQLGPQTLDSFDYALLTLLNKCQWYWARIPVGRGLFGHWCLSHDLHSLPASLKYESDQNHHCFLGFIQVDVKTCLALSRYGSSHNGIPMMLQVRLLT